MTPSSATQTGCDPEQVDGLAINLVPISAGSATFPSPTSHGIATRQSASKAALNHVHTLYKTAISPLLHSAGVTGNCRFQPTCSEYATLALAQHGLVRGLWLAATRLLRCHPFARGGWDPVPSSQALQRDQPPDARSGK